MFKVYNTLGRKYENLEALKENKILLYRCGPTVYWVQHIGNMRGMVMSDEIVRSLIYLGYEVDQVRNYTDVGHLTSDEDAGEDKMAKGAKREGITPKELADKYIAQFEKDTNELNILEPNHKPRATEYIEEMIEMVKILLEKGFAYITPKAIYFDIEKFPKYTELSGQKIEMNKASAGHGDVSDSDKKNPADFAIWFFKTGEHKNALQYWPSPFSSPDVEDGNGFPGWHLECSAMAMKLLGETIDIHIGGVEHIPVHHTNEIAQSEAFSGKKFVNYWLHHEMLDVDGQKMSKSIGNIYSLEDIKKKIGNPLVLRYLFLQSHYRSKQNFTFEALDGAKSAYTKLINKLEKLLSSIEGQEPSISENYKKKFIDFIEDDFNIPGALSILWELLNDKDVSDNEKYHTIIDFDKVLGLELDKAARNNIKLDSEILENDEVNLLVMERELAKKEKNYTRADEIRDLLKTRFGVEVLDTKEGPVIKVLS